MIFSFNLVDFYTYLLFYARITINCCIFFIQKVRLKKYPNR
ncbi:hypothetical protein HMPREF1366_02688 [Enterococcus faecium ERV26]|nr:hypothetical protein HMPREF1381_00559 [Enterococcus faecium R501]EJX70498.1 hypothetical protein HMPREF1373_01810 [Enterococcus faecium P1140]EJX77070.1 hypothetical protein HMPREF1372_01555 [Enterococcus faecium P1139]EJX89115.1 hypothetical protein HMPREF1367_01870 [Enterococcus faecium ERV38]EJX89456.1 hypothetical protein HMPREF1366_02688 [Enterococcus faecium ERV26]EJX98328.1 hypothetical protein HMPREF1365_00176 [Enterococcus faecium ERV168]EJY12219.1 hypothetical protein HMPREF1359_